MQFEITGDIRLYGRTFKRGQTGLLREYIEREGFQASAEGPTHTGAAALESFCGKYARRGQIRLIGLEDFEVTLTEADAAFYETYPGQTPGNDELPAPEAVEVEPAPSGYTGRGRGVALSDNPIPCTQGALDACDAIYDATGNTVDLSLITGTGKDGRITKADVQAFTSGGV